LEIRKLRNPCSYRPAARIVFAGVKIDRQKNVLNDIFRITAPPQYLRCDHKHKLPIPGEQNIEGLVASVLNSADQILVGGSDAVFLPATCNTVDASNRRDRLVGSIQRRVL